MAASLLVAESDESENPQQLIRIVLFLLFVFFCLLHKCPTLIWELSLHTMKSMCTNDLHRYSGVVWKKAFTFLLLLCHLNQNQILHAGSGESSSCLTSCWSIYFNFAVCFQKWCVRGVFLSSHGCTVTFQQWEQIMHYNKTFCENQKYNNLSNISF